MSLETVGQLCSKHAHTFGLIFWSESFNGNHIFTALYLFFKKTSHNGTHRDGQSAVSLSVSVSLFWRENDADNPAKRLSASFFCAGLLPADRKLNFPPKTLQ